MSDILKLKNLNCLEWTVNLSSTSELVSENFILHDIKCNLKCSVETFNSYFAILYFESAKRLKTAVDMRIVATSLNNNASYLKCNITGTMTSLWSKQGYSVFRGLVTFEVMIFSHIFKEKQPNAASGNAVPEASQVASYLMKHIHFRALSRDVSKLLDDNSSCDVDITCDSKTFKAHKIILSTRSTVFSAMLKSDMVEGKTGLVNVEDVKSEVFACFLRYIYSETLPELSMESAVELYKVGDKYAVEQLILTCSKFMVNNLSEGNTCDMLVLADLHSDEVFRKKVISYILDKRIPQRDKNWPRFCMNNCSLANEVLNLYMVKHCPL